MRRRAFLGLLGGLAATPVAARLPELPAPAGAVVIDGSRIATRSLTASEIAINSICAPKLSVPNPLNGPLIILEDLPHEPSPSSR